MVVSERSDAVLALGKKLLGELKLGKTTDTLTRWMVHYLAGLIKEVEKKSAKGHAANLEKCFDTILALWRHRHELPNGKRPFETLEPALRAMESLDASTSDHRYFPFERPAPSDENENKATREWLALADGLDYSARILIRHCISNAAESAIDKARPWVALAEEVGGQQVELPLLKIIIAEHDLNETDDPADGQRKLLEDRLGKLRTFIKLATAVAADYDRQLQRKISKGRIRGRSGKVPTSARLKRPERVVLITRKSPRKKKVTKKS